MRQTHTLAKALLLIALLAVAPTMAGGDDEAEGVSSRRGNPSPSAAASNVDNYIAQDEQINIDGGKDSIVKVLRVNQKNLVNDYVIALFPIKNAHPKGIRAAFRVITGKEGGLAEVVRDKKGKEAFLQVICPRFQLPWIETTLKAIDETWVKEDTDGAMQVYYRAKFRDVNDVNTIAEIPGGGDGGTTAVDDTANAILKRGEPYRMTSWLKTAHMIDVFPPQVLLDVAVYEVDLSSDSKLGLDYVAWKCGPGAELFRFVSWGFSSRQTATGATSALDPYFIARQLVAGTQHLTAAGSGYFAMVNFVLTAEYLDALVRKNRARLVTSGRINVKHAELGSLTMTDQVIHFHREPTAAQVAAGGAVAFEDTNATEWLRCLTTAGNDLTVGFSLTVVPYIGLQTTELAYVLSMNDLTGTTPDGTPMVRTNSCFGTVLLQDGTPLCVGGLRRTENVKSTAKIPVLGSLPIIGWLLGNEQNVHRQTEMIVVMTPKVVQYSNIDEELACEEDKHTRSQVLKLAKLPMLKTEYGFDQWLLGKN